MIHTNAIPSPRCGRRLKTMNNNPSGWLITVAFYFCYCVALPMGVIFYEARKEEKRKDAL
jgi:hypothetical protein